MRLTPGRWGNGFFLKRQVDVEISRFENAILGEKLPKKAKSSKAGDEDVPREVLEWAYRRYGSVRRAAAALGISRDKFVRLCRRYGVKYNPYVTNQYDREKNKALLEFCDKKRVDLDFSDVWDVAIRFSEVVKRHRIAQNEITARIKTERPVAVAFMGDLHIGNENTDYKRILEDVNAMREAEGLYVVLMGDLIDNYISNSFTSGLWEALVNLQLQKRLAEDLFSWLKGSILANVIGNHEGRSYKADAFEFQAYLSEKYDVPYLRHGGMIRLVVGGGGGPGVEYKIAIRHKYRFNSSFNLTHTVKRLFEHFGVFDVSVVAHGHVPAIEETIKHGEYRIFIRTGTYKVTDYYTEESGFYGAAVAVPTVVFFPDRKKMLPFRDFRDALSFLQHCERA